MKPLVSRTATVKETEALISREKYEMIWPTLFVGRQNWRDNMRFTVTIERDEDGIWVVECPSIPGCVSQGKTRQEALENIREAIRLCLEVRAEQGLPLTVETSQVEVVA